MLLEYLNSEAYDKLINSVSDNLDWYSSQSRDCEEIGINAAQIGRSTLDLPKFELIDLPAGATNEEKNENDIANMIIVYTAWRKLTPLQAKNKQLWAYYCHCNSDYIHYIRTRWMEGSFTEDQVKKAFFVTGGRRNLVRGNALSSLWWKGYLTYDAGNRDPFWIAKTLGNSTNFADFLDTFNSYNPRRARGVVRAIAEVVEDVNSDQLKNQILRDLNRSLNRYSAVVPLDCLSEEEIAVIAKRELLRLSESDGR